MYALLYTSGNNANLAGPIQGNVLWIYNQSDESKMEYIISKSGLVDEG